MSRRVSLKDVARAAGVSTSTASRVLAGTDRNVAPELASRVHEAQQQLGYRVNAAARALRLQSSGAIALVVPAIDNVFFAELVAAFSRLLEADGRRLVTMDTNEHVAAEARQLADMDRVLVDAVVVAPVDHVDSAAAVQRLAHSRHVVQVDRVAEGVDVPSVRVDEEAGMRLLLDHLRARGHRRIQLIDAQERSSASVIRTRAFRELTGSEGRVLQADSFTVTGGREAARLAIDDGDVDAILCTADVTALGVLTALQHAGRRVPDDVALASFDGTALADVVAPGLTSLRSRVDSLARSAMSIVDDERDGDIILSPELVVRGST